MKEKMRKVRYPMLIVWGIFMGAAGTAGVKSSWHVIPGWLIGVCPENIYDTGLLFFIFFGIFFINMRLIYVRKNKSADIKEAESIWWQKDLVNCG